MNIIFVINLSYLMLLLARPTVSKLSEIEDINKTERTLSVLGKTKPKQSQTKPIFQRSIFDFSKKQGFRQIQTTLLMQNKAKL